MKRIIGPGISIPGFHVVPDSITEIAGVFTGDVTDIQNWQDGNVLQVDEVAAAPGFDLELNYVNVENIRRAALMIGYDGSATHLVEAGLWDYIEEIRKVLWTIITSKGMNYYYADLPVPAANFIDENGNSKMFVCHETMGNAAHDAFIGYGALIR
jgi:hypothetical protein